MICRPAFAPRRLDMEKHARARERKMHLASFLTGARFNMRECIRSMDARPFGARPAKNRKDERSSAGACGERFSPEQRTGGRAENVGAGSSARERGGCGQHARARRRSLKGTKTSREANRRRLARAFRVWNPCRAKIACRSDDAGLIRVRRAPALARDELSEDHGAEANRQASSGRQLAFHPARRSVRVSSELATRYARPVITQAGAIQANRVAAQQGDVPGRTDRTSAWNERWDFLPTSSSPAIAENL
jgi:hypothetical protein